MNKIFVAVLTIMDGDLKKELLRLLPTRKGRSPHYNGWRLEEYKEALLQVLEVAVLTIMDGDLKLKAKHQRKS